MLSIYIYTHTIYKYMRGIYIYNTNIQTSAVLQTACNLISAITDFSKLRSWHIRLGGSHIRGWWSLLASRDPLDAENLGETCRKSRGIKISWRFSTLSWSSRSKSTWKNRLRWLHYSCQKAETVWHCHAVVQLFACIFIIILIPWLCATHSPVTEKPPPGIPGLFWPAVAGKKTSWEYGSGQRRGTFQDHQQLVPDPQT